MSIEAQLRHQQIRNELLDSPGALQCEATLTCKVITQGGPDGLRAHQLKVHFNDEWMWPSQGDGA